MVAPITGPFDTTKRLNFSGVGSWFHRQIGMKQRFPFNLPLTYRTESRTMLAINGYSTDYPQGASWYNVNSGRSPWMRAAELMQANHPSVQDRWNVCRRKLKSSNRDPSKGAVGVLNENILGGNVVLEFRRNLSTIDSHAMKLYRMVKAVRRGDIALALKEVKYNAGAKEMPKRFVGKTTANRVLEIAFGWMPLVSDIQQAAENLTRDPPDTPFRYSASKPQDEWGDTVYADNVDQFDGTYTQRGYDTLKYQHFANVTAYMGGKVRVSNPNLYLSTQFGFGNLAGTVWEAIPWSFVVDYFVNVSEFLGQFDEWLGLTFTDTYHGYKTRDICVLKNDWRRYGHITGPGPYYHQRIWCVEDATATQRFLGLPAITLLAKRFNMSPFRAMTSIALLVQQLHKR